VDSVWYVSGRRNSTSTMRVVRSASAKAKVVVVVVVSAEWGPAEAWSWGTNSPAHRVDIHMMMPKLGLKGLSRLG
jgi:hypothetical protein